MAQGKMLTWAELRVGVFVLIALGLLAVGVLYITGGGQLGPKYQLKTYLPEVDGVQQGAPVRLDGVDVGYVRQIQLNPDVTNRLNSIELTLRINRKFQNDIRTDSVASLITEGLLGNRYVTISRGVTGTPLKDNGTLKGGEEVAIKQIVQRGADLVQNLSVLTNDIGDVVQEVKEGQGTLGKLLKDPSLYNHLNATAAGAEQLVAATREQRGTLGKLIYSDAVYQKANDTLNNANLVIAAVRDGKGSLGKMVNDPAFYNNAESFLQRGNSLLEGVQEGKGTLGRLVTDQALYNNLRDASANVRDASAKLNSQSGTMGKFFTDPQLYDNLTGLTADMRQLMKDFHENPKKYLHVKFSIF